MTITIMYLKDICTSIFVVSWQTYNGTLKNLCLINDTFASLIM